MISLRGIRSIYLQKKKKKKMSKKKLASVPPPSSLHRKYHEKLLQLSEEKMKARPEEKHSPAPTPENQIVGP